MEYFIFSILFILSVIYVFKYISTALVTPEASKCSNCEIKNLIKK